MQRTLGILTEDRDILHFFHDAAPEDLVDLAGLFSAPRTRLSS